MGKVIVKPRNNGNHASTLPPFDRYFKIITVYSTNSRLHPLLINSERSHIPIIVILFIVLKLCSMITLLSGYEQSGHHLRRLFVP